MQLPQSAAYGWLMLAAVIVSLSFWIRAAKRDERLVFIFLAAMAGAFLGSKMVYLAAEGWMFRADPHRWTIWATGKTILGALLGGYAAVEASKRLVRYTEPTGDTFAAVAPLGIVIGRVGCLLHGCCTGRPCEPAWYTLTDASGVARWPSVPTEIGFNVIALVGFMVLRRNQRLKGQHFHIYLIAYGCFRFLHEFLRATPRLTQDIPFTGYHLAAGVVATLGIWQFQRRSRELNEARQEPQ